MTASFATEIILNICCAAAKIKGSDVAGAASGVK